MVKVLAFRVQDAHVTFEVYMACHTHTPCLKCTRQWLLITIPVEMFGFALTPTCPKLNDVTLAGIKWQ